MVSVYINFEYPFSRRKLSPLFRDLDNERLIYCHLDQTWKCQLRNFTRCWKKTECTRKIFPSLPVEIFCCLAYILDINNKHCVISIHLLKMTNSEDGLFHCIIYKHFFHNWTRKIQIFFFFNLFFCPLLRILA